MITAAAADLSNLAKLLNPQDIHIGFRARALRHKYHGMTDFPVGRIYGLRVTVA